MTEHRKPARPRDAATLLIYRRGARGPEVVMGRRSDKARFKPGVYVFPGGGLERADHQIRPLRPLPQLVVDKIAVGGSVARGNALALAAIRETFEESGLIIGEAGDPGPSTSDSWRSIRARGLAPRLDALSYLGRAITPSPQPIRFHARFFAVDAAHAHGDLGSSGELSDLQWVPLADASKFEVMGVTLLMLESLQRYLEAPAAHRAPFLSFQHGRRVIQMTP
ncbi:MAG: NUDIX hydrolase [Candidatus Binatia bacterium]